MNHLKENSNKRERGNEQYGGNKEPEIIYLTGDEEWCQNDIQQLQFSIIKCRYYCQNYFDIKSIWSIKGPWESPTNWSIIVVSQGTLIFDDFKKTPGEGYLSMRKKDAIDDLFMRPTNKSSLIIIGRDGRWGYAAALYFGYLYVGC